MEIFQYLSLLFTEIYLDRYFADPEALRSAISVQITKLNEANEKSDHIQDLLTLLICEDLNKIAF